MQIQTDGNRKSKIELVKEDISGKKERGMRRRRQIKFKKRYEMKETRMKKKEKSRYETPKKKKKKNN